MTTDLTTTLVDAQMIPIRFWWLKRIVAAFALLAVALCIIHWQWHAMAERYRLRNEQYLKQTKAEMGLDRVVECTVQQRAALALFSEAAHRVYLPYSIHKKLVKRRAMSRNLFGLRAGWSEADFDDLQFFNQWLIDLVRKARKGDVPPRDRWPEMPDLETDSPDQALTDLSALFIATAVQRYTEGNDAEAMQCLLDLMYVRKLSELMRSTHTVPIEPYTIQMLDGIVPNLAAAFASDLFLDGDQLPDHPQIAPAAKSQVRELIQMLLDDEFNWEHHRRVNGRRSEWALSKPAYTASLTQFFSTNVQLTSFQRKGVDLAIWLLQPMYDLDGRRANEFWIDDLRELSNRVPDTQRLVDMRLRNQSKVGFLFDFTRRFSSFRYYLKHMPIHSTTQHSLAAVALADMLFHRDHDRHARTIHELVPEYLPRIVPDPYDPQQQPIRMATDNGKPYSVGFNGIDENGKHDFEFDKAKNSIEVFEDDIYLEWRTGGLSYHRKKLRPKPERQSGKNQQPSHDPDSGNNQQRWESGSIDQPDEVIVNDNQ
jgi:hypothetical protein